MASHATFKEVSKVFKRVVNARFAVLDLLAVDPGAGLLRHCGEPVQQVSRYPF